MDRKFFRLLLIILLLSDHLKNQAIEDTPATMNFEEQVEEAEKPWREQNHHTPLTVLDVTYLADLDRKVSSSLTPKKRRLSFRKEYHCMDPTEREIFDQTLIQMKRNMAGENSEYDTFVLHHDGLRSPSAHSGPSFIIWHRMLLFLVENAMQKYHRNVAMPYWDNRLERRVPGSPKDSVLFSADLMGTAEGIVSTGPYVDWRISSEACRKISLILSRNVSESKDNLYNETFTDILQSLETYEDWCYPWNKFFEEAHGKIHVFVGGQMRQVMCAPFDPIFYMHHAFVDYLYERYFRQPAIDRDRTPAYPDISDFDLDNFYNSTHRMLPFGIRHADMLKSVKFVPKYYQSPGDIVCSTDADCCPRQTSLYVWCDQADGKCVTKLVEGAVVSPVGGIDVPPRACYCKTKQPAILNGRCSCV